MYVIAASARALRGGKSSRKSLKSAHHAGKWRRVTHVTRFAGRGDRRC
jgi:hypothetical protein